MKSRLLNQKIVTAAAIIALFGMAVPAFAWMGNWSGYGMGYTGGAAVSETTLNAEQQKQMDAVHNRYRPQLKDLQQKLDAKASELAAARSRSNSTPTRLNALEGEIFQLERRYWTLLDQANAEASRVAGSSSGPYFTCGYTGCNHRDHSGGTRTMGPGRRVGCCW